MGCGPWGHKEWHTAELRSAHKANSLRNKCIILEVTGKIGMTLKINLIEGLSIIWTVLEGIELKTFTLLYKHYL